MPELSHRPCPDQDGCGSSNAYSFNTDKGVGRCFSCQQHFFDLEKPLKRPDKNSNHDQYEDDFMMHSSSGKVSSMGVGYEEGGTSDEGGYFDYRGVSPKTMEFYNTKTKFDGNQFRWQRYVYPSGGYKLRLPDKDFRAKGIQSDELFGMNLFPAGCSKMVTITEGELDALSAFQMLSGGTNYINPVVSLPSATPSKKLWENKAIIDWLNSFEKIILSIDNDEPGDAVSLKISRLFPGKVYRVIHGEYKDANEFLVNGKGSAYKSSWWAASKYVPDNVLNTTEHFLNLFRDTPNHQYIPTGIQALDDRIMGLMQGHFTVIKAQTGIGKTEFMRFLEFNLLKRGVPFAAWHLEETKLRSLLGLVSYDLQGNYTRRDVIDAKDAAKLVEQSIENITKDELFYQFYLSEGQGADELCQQIRYFAEGCGCKYVFFEPIQDVVSGVGEDNKEPILADLSVRLSKMAAELGVGIVTIAHTNENGDPKYCKMIAQRASVVIDLQRDKTAEDVLDRNTTKLYVEKNRPASDEGPSGALRFDPETFLLREIYDA